MSAALASAISCMALSSLFGRLLIFVVMLLSSGAVRPGAVHQKTAWQIRQNSHYKKLFKRIQNAAYVTRLNFKRACSLAGKCCVLGRIAILLKKM